MKKNIVIFILSVISIISLVFSFAQATIAQHAVEESEMQREIALVQSRIAQINADSAVVAQSRAELQAERARLCEIEASHIMIKLYEAKDALAKCK